MKQLKHIALELKRHAPFTAFGAGTGVVIMGIIAGLKFLLLLHILFFTSFTRYIFY